MINEFLPITIYFVVHYTLLVLTYDVKRNCTYVRNLCLNIKPQKGLVDNASYIFSSENHLRICSNEVACCSEEMEHNLSIHGCSEVHKLLQSELQILHDMFSSEAQNFDKFFIEIMKASKKEFHEAFYQEYGIIYDVNSFIFIDMFTSLEKYYLTGSVDLSDTLDSFFHKLYRIMFQLLNRQYTFSDSYLNCVSHYMDEMKLFGDAPRKLTFEIKRSLIATRTFVQDLIIGRDVIKNILEVTLTPECCRAVMKMNYCQGCEGFPNVKPCDDYCISVMRNCLAYHTEMHTEWNNYIDAMILLAVQLEKFFDTESVVDPIDVISDAVATFQTNDEVISQKLFRQCGTPERYKRDVLLHPDFAIKQFHHQHSMIGSSHAANSSINKLVQNMKDAFKANKKFWTLLPIMICNYSVISLQTNAESSDICWNGLVKLQYNTSTSHEGSVKHNSSSEVNVDVTHQNSIINQQILTLKLVTNKLVQVYNGLDVVLQDSVDEWISSGSGSGHGAKEAEDHNENFQDIYFSYTLLPDYASKSVSVITSFTWNCWLLKYFLIFFFLITNIVFNLKNF